MTNSIIDSVLEYHNDYKSKTGRNPTGPFFVFESEWEKFVASDQALKFFPNAAFEPYNAAGKFTIGNMYIYIIREDVKNV